MSPSLVLNSWAHLSPASASASASVLGLQVCATALRGSALHMALMGHVAWDKPTLLRASSDLVTSPRTPEAIPLDSQVAALRP